MMTTQAQPIIPMHLRPYRTGIGLVVFNHKGQVFLGERSDVNGAWQLPQGGVTADEIDTDIVAAGLRELEEETGITHVKCLAITKDWLTYDFPPDNPLSPPISQKYKGQRQKWLALRFEGDESTIDLTLHHEIEFQKWRWGDLETIPSLIIANKRAVYETVVDYFSYIPKNGTPDLTKLIDLTDRS